MMHFRNVKREGKSITFEVETDERKLVLMIQDNSDRPIIWGTALESFLEFKKVLNGEVEQDVPSV